MSVLDAPPPDRDAASPRPGPPALVLGSAAVLLALTGAALAHSSFGFAAHLLVAGLVPAAPRERLRRLGIWLAYAGLGWCLVATALVPLGARVTAVFLPTGAAFVFRVWALAGEGARRWTGSRARWALAFAGPIDRLAITCLDRIESLPRRAVVESWEVGVDLERTIPGERTELARRAVPVVRKLGRGESLVAAAEGILRRRVDLESWGPAASDKRLRL